VQKFITDSDVLLLLVTPESMASPWVRKEIYAAMTLEKTILNIKLQEAPMPPFFNEAQTFDLSQYTERRYKQLLSELIAVLGHEMENMVLKQITPPTASDSTPANARSHSPC
jgi:light-regulated signal transduction histidine kinase (bacteriophytochrome)